MMCTMYKQGNTVIDMYLKIVLSYLGKETDMMC